MQQELTVWRPLQHTSWRKFFLESPHLAPFLLHFHFLLDYSLYLKSIHVAMCHA